jgi:hypothetical protein
MECYVPGSKTKCLSPTNCDEDCRKDSSLQYERWVVSTDFLTKLMAAQKEVLMPQTSAILHQLIFLLSF